MQHVQEQNSRSKAEMADTQAWSYPKRLEIWSGRLAMVGFMTTAIVLVWNAGY